MTSDDKVLATFGMPKDKDGLESKLRYFNSEYRDGNPLISDEKYDIIKEIFERKFGSLVLMDNSYGVVKPLKYVMGSMNKVSEIGELQEWLSNYDGDLHLSAKFDGISILKGLMIAQTRGEDGINGTVVTNPFSLIENGNNHLKNNIDQRGECVISWSSFNEIFLDLGYSHPRNAVAGLFRDKSPNAELLKHVRFIPFDDFSGGYKNSTDHPYYEICKKEDISFDKLSSLFSIWGKDYPIDGLVIEKMDEKAEMFTETGTNNPVSARAFKHKSFYGRAKTKVNLIKRQISKYGRLSPVLSIDPIYVEGAEITSVYVDNEMFLKVYGIGEGSEVEVIRSGGIIPRLLSVDGIKLPNSKKERESLLAVLSMETSIEEKRIILGISNISKYEEPNFSYKWVGLDIITEEENDKISILVQKCLHFLSSVGIKHVGAETIKFLCESKLLTSTKDLFSFNWETMLSYDGWGEQKIEKIKQEFASKLQNVREEKLMAASSIFKGLGEEKLRLYITNGIGSKGLGEVASKTINEGLPEWLEFMEEAKNNGVSITKPSNTTATQVYCHSNCRIGEDIKMEISKSGGMVVDGFSSKVTTLVVDSLESDTSKIKKAKKAGIPIITMIDLIKKYKKGEVVNKNESLF
jgi:NAD-dependent DNA ligase